MKEEKKPCRLCETERKTIMHVMKECNYSETGERIENLISEEGQKGRRDEKHKKETGRKKIKGEKKEGSVR